MCNKQECAHDDRGSTHGRPDVSRRRFLALATAGGGAMIAASAAAAASAARVQPEVAEPPPATPGEALERLYRGNERFATGKVRAPHRSLDRVRDVAPSQSPFAAFLGCADSRVPIEIVFDQGFGDVFVTRVAGNVVDPAIIGSLEFGTVVLGAKVVYVLGHTACGAVSATMKGDAVPGQISTLYQHLRPAVRASGGDLNRAIIENVRNQAALLAESSPVLAGLIRDGRLKVAGGVYDLATGRVTPVSL